MTPRTVLVIVESCFGNTGRVADAIAAGLSSAGARVQVAPAEIAEAAVAGAIDLVLVGAPTHNAGLPTPSTRTQAATPDRPARLGVREWVATARIPAVAEVVAFDTVTGGAFSGSAAKAAVKALRRRRIRAERGESFRVSGREGPLVDGELDRARAWGESLAARGR
jgi:hypothetical protein